MDRNVERYQFCFRKCHFAIRISIFLTILTLVAICLMDGQWK
ncbi:MAG: hypothetical protein ACLPWF_10570 [Bryobacteraceae bacterium]